LKLPALITPGDLANLSGAHAAPLNGVEVLLDPTEHPVSNAELEGFLSLFQDRFRTLSAIIKRNHEGLINTSGISEVLRTRGRDKGFVAMVREIGTTKKGHTRLLLEDETGELTGYILKNRGVKINPPPIEDEVLGVVGDVAKEGDTVFIREIYRPDVISLERRVTLSREEAYLLVTSDTHVGSRTFLKDKWNSFVSWLNSGGKVKGLDEGVIDKIRFMIIAGDLVDGVGIYKDQDKDLEIVNIMEQYEALAEALTMLPSHIKLILIPGNHDAVRLLEPQPALPKEIRNLFPSKYLFLGSPTYVNLLGIKVLAYHGRSIDDLITKIPGASYENPIKAQLAMLKMRHLCPVYGGRTPIAPLQQDLLVIREVPDVLISGHIHRFEVETYRGVVVVQASAWQGQTEYQKMRNIQPQPARAALIGLHDLSVREIDFSGKTPKARLVKPPVKVRS